MSFLEALRSSGSPLIAEIKPRLPDGSSLTCGRSLPELVQRYHELGPACLSVVTGRWFGGTPILVKQVRELSDRPILRKDFITRRHQLVESIELGADAVLLTAELLPPEGLNRLVSGCLELGLTPFVEVTTAEQIERIAQPSSCVVAVNNRDIRTKERTGDGIARSRELVEMVIGSRCAFPISASGIDHPDTGRELLSLGYRGLLVGTALLRASDHLAWRELAATPVGAA